MQIKLDKHGFTLIEFFLSIVALFLLLIITYPILQELTERTQTSQIKENLTQIRNYSDQYFEEHATNSVSLYEFIGPRKVIPELEIIADEDTPKQFFAMKKFLSILKNMGQYPCSKDDLKFPKKYLILF